MGDSGEERERVGKKGREWGRVGKKGREWGRRGESGGEWGRRGDSGGYSGEEICSYNLILSKIATKTLEKKAQSLYIHVAFESGAEAISAVFLSTKTIVCVGMVIG